MKKKQIKKVTDFLSVKVLSPLEEREIVGGTNNHQPVHTPHGPNTHEQG